MDLFKGKAYAKALVIGAGSGRDVASSILVAEGLRLSGVQVDLGGFLTPWALHTFEGELERPVNELSGGKTRKFLSSDESVSLASYFEPELVVLNRELNLGVGQFFLFSLHYGTRRLRDELDKLIIDNAYDLVIAVDIGGDILARDKDYPWLRTPIVDFSCLNVLGELTTRVKRYLMVAAPGLDGELPGSTLKEIFKELEASGSILSSGELNEKSKPYQTYRRVNEEINSRTASRSNTFRLIERLVQSGGEHVADRFEKRVKLGEREWKLTFPIDVPCFLAKKIYCFELETVHARKSTPLAYESIFEAFVRMKQLGAGGTEVDLSHVPRRIQGGLWEDLVYCLTPPERVDEAIRKDIIHCGLDLTSRGRIGRSVLLEKDLGMVDLPGGLQVNKQKALDTDLVLVHLSRKETADPLS